MGWSSLLSGSLLATAKQLCVTITGVFMLYLYVDCFGSLVPLVISAHKVGLVRALRLRLAHTRPSPDRCPQAPEYIAAMYLQMLLAAAQLAGPDVMLVLVIDHLRRDVYKRIQAVGAVRPSYAREWTPLLEKVVRCIVAYAATDENMNVIGAVGDGENVLGTIGPVEPRGTAGGLAVDTDTLRCAASSECIALVPPQHFDPSLPQAVNVTTLLRLLPAKHKSVLQARKDAASGSGVPAGTQPMHWLTFILLAWIGADYCPKTATNGWGPVKRFIFCETVTAETLASFGKRPQAVLPLPAYVTALLLALYNALLAEDIEFHIAGGLTGSVADERIWQHLIASVVAYYFCITPYRDVSCTAREPKWLLGVLLPCISSDPNVILPESVLPFADIVQMLEVYDDGGQLLNGLKRFHGGDFCKILELADDGFILKHLLPSSDEEGAQMVARVRHLIATRKDMRTFGALPQEMGIMPRFMASWSKPGRVARISIEGQLYVSAGTRLVSLWKHRDKQVAVCCCWATMTFVVGVIEAEDSRCMRVIYSSALHDMLASEKTRPAAMAMLEGPSLARLAAQTHAGRVDPLGRDLAHGARCCRTTLPRRPAATRQQAARPLSPPTHRRLLRRRRRRAAGSTTRRWTYLCCLRPVARRATPPRPARP